MDGRLEQLAAKLGALPKPSGETAAAVLTLAAGQAKLLANVPWDVYGEDERRQLLATCAGTEDHVTSLLGEKHQAVVILRQMMAIITADIEGRPAPTDEELARIGGKGGGCFSFVGFVVIAAVLGLTWATA